MTAAACQRPQRRADAMPSGSRQDAPAEQLPGAEGVPAAAGLQACGAPNVDYRVPGSDPSVSAGDHLVTSPLRALTQSRRWPALIWLICLSAATVHAENLIDLYQLAAQRDPVVNTARFGHLAVHESLAQAHAGLRPTVSFGAGYDLTRQNILKSRNPLYAEGITKFDGYNVTLNLSQPLFRYPSIVQLRQARAGEVRSALELAQAEQELVGRVAGLYLAALASQDDVQFSRAEQAALEAHCELARMQRERGVVPVTDLYEAQARLADGSARQLSVQNALDDALEALRETCGRRPVSLAGLGPTLPLVPPDPADEQAWVQAALEQNLALRIQRQAMAVAGYEVDRLWAGHLPTADLTATGGRQQTGGSLLGEGTDAETASVRVELNVPLYHGGLLRSQVREARQRQRQSGAEEQRLLRAAERMTRSSYRGVLSAMGQVEALRQAVASTELALEAGQKGFSSGLVPSPDVLDNIRDLFQARRDFARARYSYIINSLRLRETVGTLKADDIATVNQWLAE
jgi:outer membrane protein